MSSMTKKRALLMGNGANSYVQSKMKLGAANNYLNPNMWFNEVETKSCVLQARAEISSMYKGKTVSIIEYTLKKAAILENTGCGNCHEQASLAFAWLIKNRVGPIEIMHFSNADHVFCVLNRSILTKVENPDQWNEDSVYCDPWRNTVTLGRDMARSNRNSALGFGSKKYHFSVMVRVEANSKRTI